MIFLVGFGTVSPLRLWRFRSCGPDVEYRFEGRRDQYRLDGPHCRRDTARRRLPHAAPSLVHITTCVSRVPVNSAGTTPIVAQMASIQGTPDDVRSTALCARRGRSARMPAVRRPLLCRNIPRCGHDSRPESRRGRARAHRTLASSSRFRRRRNNATSERASGGCGSAAYRPGKRVEGLASSPSWTQASPCCPATWPARAGFRPTTAPALGPLLDPRGTPWSSLPR
jgi:hypothetical protein